MKTPEEIKRGLECCSSTANCTDGCPYYVAVEEIFGYDEIRCVDGLLQDAIALIQKQEAKLDAALDHIRGDCAYCAHLPGETFPNLCFDCANKGYYRWEFRDGQKED